MSQRIHKRAYTGTVQAVVLDWAGTVVDFGSIGPAAVFVEVFKTFGVEVTLSQVRRFMGMAKKDHIRNLCGLPEVRIQWEKQFKGFPDESDVEWLYAQTEPMMIEAIRRHANLIPGTMETVAELRKRGIKIGSSTGYTAPMMETLVPAARSNGYAPDVMICASDVPAGRPYPWMCFLNAIRLEVYPLEAMVVVGDTVSDIEAGLNAGMWTVGLTQSGNELGLSQAEVSRLSAQELDAETDAIIRRYREAGAHYTAAGVWDLFPVIDAVNARLAHGEKP